MSWRILYKFKWKTFYWFEKKQRMYKSRDVSNLALRFTLKDAATHKMRLRVTGYYQGKNLYLLLNELLIRNYKDYSVNKQKKLLLVKSLFK